MIESKMGRRGRKKYNFFYLEKRNYNNKYIKKLISDNNKELTNLEDIIEEKRQFYKTLYTSKRNFKDKPDVEELF